MSDFRTYRAITNIHLPPPVGGQLTSQEIITFDGTTIKREDGTELKLPYPSALNGAIKAGWLVPIESTTTEYVPQSAGVEVRAAQSTGDKREVINVMTVQNEERNLGDRVALRAGADHNSAQKVSRGAPTGVVVADDSGGVVVGRMKTSAKGGTIEIGKGDQAIKNKIDNGAPAGVEKVARATGDVQEALVGDSLQDLLPDAASSKTPEPGVFENDGVQVSSAGSSVGSQEDGVVVGKVGEPRAVSKDLDRSASALEKALRSWAETGKTWDGKPPALLEIAVMVKSVLRSLDLARNEVVSLTAQVEALQATPKADAVAEAPTEFEWDLATHWKTRQKSALNEYGDDAEALNAILAAENSAAVKKAVTARLAELEG